MCCVHRPPRSRGVWREYMQEQRRNELLQRELDAAHARIAELEALVPTAAA